MTIFNISPLNHLQIYLNSQRQILEYKQQQFYCEF